MEIIETASGTGYNTRQFVIVDEDKCEVRDASGNLVAQYFSKGQTISGSKYYYTTDHLGSVRELTDSSATIQAQYSFSPYGVSSKLQGSLSSDFQFVIAYYVHARSGLYLTQTRDYNAVLGRWLNRDSIEEDGGINLYCYVNNNPLCNIDPSGMAGKKLPSASPYKNCYVGDKSCCGFNRNQCHDTCPPCDAIKQAQHDPALAALYPSSASCHRCCAGHYNQCTEIGIQFLAGVVGARAKQAGNVNAGCSQPGTMQ